MNIDAVMLTVWTEHDMHQEYGEGSLLVHNIVHSCKLAWGIYLLLLLLLVLQMQTIDTLDSNKPKLHCVHMMTLYHLQYYDRFFLDKIHRCNWKSFILLCNTKVLFNFTSMLCSCVNACFSSEKTTVEYCTVSFNSIKIGNFTIWMQFSTWNHVALFKVDQIYPHKFSLEWKKFHFEINE